MRDCKDAAPASSPGGPPRTWAPFGVLGRPCAKSPWDGMTRQPARLRRAVPHGPALPMTAPRRRTTDVPDSHPVPLHSPPLRPGAPDTPDGSADCNAVRSAPQPDPPSGRTASDGLKFRMVTSGIRAAALLCRSGTAWVSDRIQTRAYRRRPLPGLEEHDAKSQEHSNHKRTLVTHSLDDGRSSQAGAPAFAIALKTRVDSTLRRGPQSTFYAAGVWLFERVSPSAPGCGAE